MAVTSFTAKSSTLGLSADSRPTPTFTTTFSILGTCIEFL
jgi:hypothetical protein